MRGFESHRYPFSLPLIFTSSALYVACNCACWIHIIAQPTLKNVIEELSPKPDHDRCSEFCITKCLPRCFYLPFRIIFGELPRQDKMWRNIANQNVVSTRAAWITTLSLAAPLFSVSSHVAFILVAWLTDTEKASSVAPICLAVLLYFFLMFRQCYAINKGIRHKNICSGNYCDDKCCFTFCLPFYPLLSYIKECYKNISNSNNGNSPDNSDEDISDWFETKTAYHKTSAYFDTKAFCITLSWGLILAIPIITIIAVFHKLPIVSVSLISEVIGTVEIFIIILSLLVSYKILSYNESDTSRFLHQLRENLIENLKQRKKKNGMRLHVMGSVLL